MFYRLREGFARFMYGRYGTDNLNRFISLLFFIVIILQIFIRSRILWIIELVLLILLYARMLSRNIYKRQAENERYLRIRDRITRGRFNGFGGFGGNQGYGSGGYAGYSQNYNQGSYSNGYAGQRSSAGPKFNDRLKYKYLKCPSCSQKVRIPRGKGKVEITCPRCRTIFQSRS